MSNYCRFCQGKLDLLFPGNNDQNLKDLAQYACTSNSFGRHGPIVLCQKCGIIYQDEKINQQQISTYYEVVNDLLYFAEQPAREITFRRYLSKLENHHPKRGRLLDIGTNTGLFVKLAKDNGWEAFGLEPNKWSVEYAKTHYGITLINKLFIRGLFKTNSFDVITMWDVIEHFPDPIAEMKKVYQYLKPGGVFAFSTTDPKSYFARLLGTKWPWYMAMHRVFICRPTARYYLLKTGFKSVRFTSHWRNLSLGYLATRLEAISPVLSKSVGKLISWLKLSKVVVPYYANDLYDCYAFK